MDTILNINFNFWLGISFDHLKNIVGNDIELIINVKGTITPTESRPHNLPNRQTQKGNKIKSTFKIDLM